MNKRHPIIKINISILIIILLIILLPNNAKADGTDISISPAIMKIQAKPPADIWTPFFIENKSSQPVDLTIGYKLFDKKASQNGNVVFLKNGHSIPGPDKKIFQKMQIVDDNGISHNTIDLGPQQKERFRLRITLPDNEPSGDYYFSLILIEKNNNSNQTSTINNKNNQKSSSTLLEGIGTNIFLAIGDQETPLAAITTFSTPWFRQNGPVPFTLTVQNNGMHFITPHGSILIRNMFNQPIGKISIPPSIILAGTSRTLTSNQTIDSATPSTNEYAGNTPLQIIWPQHFLLGFYTAVVSFSFSDKGPVFTRSIHFIAIPLLPLLYCLITILVIFAIYYRVRRMIK